jgi:hypothetical protein
MILRRTNYVFLAVLLAISSLFILAPKALAAPDTCEWTGLGGDTNFTTAANWAGCDNGAVPEDGDTLEFPVGAASFTPNNDFANGTNFNLVFTGTYSDDCAANSYSFSGNQILLDFPVLIQTNGTCSTPEVINFSNDFAVSGSVVVERQNTDVETSLDFLDSAISGSGTLEFRNVSVAVDSVSSTDIFINNANLELTISDCATPTVATDLIFANDVELIVSDGGICDEYTLSNVSLGANTLIDADNAAITISNLDSSGFTLAVQNGAETTVTVNYSANSPATNLIVSGGVQANVSGTYGDVTVQSLGYLMGNGGTLGNVTIESGGFLAPGNSPGCLNMANLNVVGTYAVEIQGDNPCTGYDQVTASGSVDLTGSTLNVSVSGFVPSTGQEFMIINKTSPGLATSAFDLLSEGDGVVVNGVTFIISYVGGDGNDVVLTVDSVDESQIPGVTPDAPDTGAGVTTKNYILLSALLFVLALAYAYAARRSFNK